MSKRSYIDGCATAHALDLIGDRWSMPIMRELLLGPKRFTDIRAGLPGISANVLTQKLEALEEAGILRRRRLPPPAPVQVYELTQWGAESEILFKVMGRWACRSPAHMPGPMSTSSIIMSMRTMIDLEKAKGLNARIGFRFGSETFVATLGPDGFHADRGDVDGADLLFDGDQNAFAAVLYGGVPFDTVADALTISGDRLLAERFVTLFPLPEKAVPTSA